MERKTLGGRPSEAYPFDESGQGLGELVQDHPGEKLVTDEVLCSSGSAHVVGPTYEPMDSQTFRSVWLLGDLGFALSTAVGHVDSARAKDVSQPALFIDIFSGNTRELLLASEHRVEPGVGMPVRLAPQVLSIEAALLDAVNEVVLGNLPPAKILLIVEELIYSTVQSILDAPVRFQ